MPNLSYSVGKVTFYDQIHNQLNSYDAIIGGGGNGPAPNGDYTINIQQTEGIYGEFFDDYNNKWKVGISPKIPFKWFGKKAPRFQLLIHPVLSLAKRKTDALGKYDAPTTMGTTVGCTGISGDQAAEFKRVFLKHARIIKNYNINISGNPDIKTKKYSQN
jgi:hypothetical protein